MRRADFADQERVRDAGRGGVRSGDRVLQVAAEAAADGARKLDAALRRRIDLDVGKIAVIDTFTSVQLDLALGRSNVIHAALLAGRESDTFMARAELLGRFRTGGLADRNEPKPAEKTEKQERNG